MTRTHTPKAVWTWICDRCGRSSGDLAWTQWGLPTIDEMRKRGWFIAELVGDMCPRCLTPAEASS